MNEENATREELLAEMRRLRTRVQMLEAAIAPAADTVSLPDVEPARSGITYSQQQIADILESMPSAIVIIRAADGRFEYANGHARNLYGMDYVGMDLDNHLPMIQALKPDGTPYVVEELPVSRSIRKGEIVINEEIIIRQPSGHQLTILGSSAPLRNSQGKIIAAVSSFLDITERRQFEEALKATLATAEARTRELEAIFTSVPDGLVIFDNMKRPVFINEAARKAFGLFRLVQDPVTGDSMMNVFDQQGRLVPESEAPLERILRHGETIQAAIYTTKPDEDPVIYISLSGAPIRDNDDTITGALILTRDITERRKTAIMIAFQAHLLESVQDPIIATDGTFHITYLNRAAEALFGFSADEAIGKSTLELLHPTVLESSMEEAIDQLMRDNAYVGDVVYHHKDGTPITVENHAHLIRDDKGRVRETITIGRDVRERKLAEEALRESERRYRELVRHAPTGIYEIDIIRRRFVTVNDCMVQMTGYSRDELLNMDPMDLLDDASYKAFLKRMRQWESGETPDQNVDYTWIVKDGRAVHVALNTTFGLDSNGKPKVMTVIAHDITERMQLETALKRQTEELLIANRNKSLFLNMLSHELRNPLAAIVASLELMSRQKNDEERAQRAMRVLQRQTGHLTRLVDDLLDVTRITTNKIRLEKAPVDFTGLIQRIVTDQQPQFDSKGVNLNLALPAGQPIIIQADPTRITQAVSNLLHNALKFTPGGGTVAVTVRLEKWSPDEPSAKSVPTSETSERDDSTEASRQAVSMTVEDNGTGIAPDVLPEIFEPFAQAEQPLARTQGGLGLGLAIVRGMVELHGGRVYADSEGTGMGTRFTVLLPIDGES